MKKGKTKNQVKFMRFWNCFCNVETSIQLTPTERVFYKTRLTACFVEKEERLQASVLHMSESSVHQEENEFFPLRFAIDQTENLNKESQHDLMEFICQVMPGGIIGGYMEEGFPLYVINDQCLELMGYTYDELLKDTDGYISNTIHEDDVAFVTEYVVKQLQNQKQYDIEYRLKKKDGTYIWVYDVGRKIYAKDGREAIGADYNDLIEEKYPLSNSSLSFGGVYRKDSLNFENLYQEADKVLYHIKDKEKNQYQIVEE